MVESPRFSSNTPAAVRLIKAYREAWMPSPQDPYWRECVAFTVQSACINNEVSLEWVLGLHRIPGNALYEGYWEGMREHFESLPFIEEIRFENISDFDELLDKISAMGENDRLILGLFPNDRRSHMAHVVGIDSRALEKGFAIMVNDNEKNVREINKIEFQRNIAPEPVYNCIFFKETD